MATLQELNEIVARIRRLQDRIAIELGPGTEWKADVPGQGTQTYKLTGMTSPAEIEDDLLSLSLWVWSFKDHLKAFLAAEGRDPNQVERFVDSDPDLRICADLANSSKHSKLTHTRTGQSLRAGRLRFTIPQSAIGGLVHRAHEIQIDVERPEEVTFILPVVDGLGNEVLGGHLKTGQLWTGQNRPVERGARRVVSIAVCPRAARRDDLSSASSGGRT